MNDCGACVTIAATACATSSGCNILLGSFPACGLSSVSTEPGQITEARTLCFRNSSETEEVNPFSPHLDAAYAATLVNALFPDRHEMMMICKEYTREMIGATVRIA